jgi:lipid-binding SYLF domain-containing protein
MLSGMKFVTAAVITVVVLTMACSTPKGETPAEKKDYADKMHRTALADLYRQKPETKAKVEGAAGYAVFSNIGMKILLLASGNGYGVVHDNETGAETYMKMREFGLGIGLGVEDFKAVFVFNDKAVMKKFVDDGWEWGADASAAAKSGDTGGAAGGDTNTESDIDVYRFTESGIALMAAVTGTKYWKDEDLNKVKK